MSAVAVCSSWHQRSGRSEQRSNFNSTSLPMPDDGQLEFDAGAQSPVLFRKKVVALALGLPSITSKSPQ
jgi:hypothetical protein